MRSAHGISTHLAQHSQTEPLQPVRQSSPYTGMVLVVARSLNLQGFAIQEEALLRIEHRGAHAEAHSFGIANFGVGLDRDDGRIEIRCVDRPQRGIRELRGCGVCRGAIHCDGLCRRLGGGNGLARCVEYLPAHPGALGLLAFIHYHGAQRQRGGFAVDGGADGALPLAQVNCIRLGKPHVPIDSGALIEPSVAEARIHAQNNVVLGAIGEEVGQIAVERRIAVVVAADKAAVHEDQHAAEGAIELHGDAAAEVARGNLEFAAVPAHAGFGIPAADGLEAVRVLLLVVHKGQLDGPVVRQIECAPFGVVELGLGKSEVAGLGKIALAEAEAQVASRIDSIAELEFPAEIEEQLLARGHSAQRLSRTRDGLICQQCGGARPCGARH